LSQVSGGNPHRSYRIKVQNYSDEKASIWEDVKHGLIYGGQEFIEDIKTRFLGDRKNAELPQHNSLFRTFDPERILKNSSKHLGLKLEAVRKAKKISPENKDKRDLMIYLLRQAGRLSNSEIGEYFGLTYSSVSRRVKIISDKIETDQAIGRKYQDLKSKIKV
jgi:chromosomal replication initiation ATPase DnaA